TSAPKKSSDSFLRVILQDLYPLVSNYSKRKQKVNYKQPISDEYLYLSNQRQHMSSVDDSIHPTKLSPQPREHDLMNFDNNDHIYPAYSTNYVSINTDLTKVEEKEGLSSKSVLSILPSEYLQMDKDTTYSPNSLTKKHRTPPNWSILCCSIVSLFGFLFLFILGWSFFINGGTLTDDISSLIQNAIKKDEIELKQEIERIYRQSSIYCWFASAVYIIVFLLCFSVLKLRLRNDNSAKYKQ
ncbi:unnamed protein product, partial [Didymodactylos carnosus]